MICHRCRPGGGIGRQIARAGIAQLLSCHRNGMRLRGCRHVRGQTSECFVRRFGCDRLDAEIGGGERRQCRDGEAGTYAFHCHRSIRLTQGRGNHGGQGRSGGIGGGTDWQLQA